MVRLDGDVAYCSRGVGGAEKMPLVDQLLREMGFEAVEGILDGNRSALADELRNEYDPYEFHVLPTADVRTMKPRPPAEAVDGLADHRRMIRPEYADVTKELIGSISDSLSRLHHHSPNKR